MDSVSVLLQTAIENWAAALAADSANPQPNYTLDNKTVDRNSWRASLLKYIEEAQNVINQRNPTIVWSGGCCGPWRGW